VEQALAPPGKPPGVSPISLITLRFKVEVVLAAGLVGVMLEMEAVTALVVIMREAAAREDIPQTETQVRVAQVLPELQVLGWGAAELVPLERVVPAPQILVPEARAVKPASPI